MSKSMKNPAKEWYEKYFSFLGVRFLHPSLVKIMRVLSYSTCLSIFEQNFTLFCKCMNCLANSLLSIENFVSMKSNFQRNCSYCKNLIKEILQILLTVFCLCRDHWYTFPFWYFQVNWLRNTELFQMLLHWAAVGVGWFHFIMKY